MTLVINDASFLSYDEKYKVFEDDEEAIKYAYSIGYQTLFGVNPKVGVLNMYACGDVKVSFMKVEPIKSTKNIEE